MGATNKSSLVETTTDIISADEVNRLIESNIKTRFLAQFTLDGLVYKIVIDANTRASADGYSIIDGIGTIIYGISSVYAYAIQLIAVENDTMLSRSLGELF